MTDEFAAHVDIFQLKSKGLQHHGLRQNNLRVVLNVIAFNAGRSNAEIARMSGLAPQTVSAILNDLEREGLIVRGPVLRGRRGQPAMPISLRAEGGYSIGIEIGWRHAEVVIIDLHATIIGHRRLAYSYPDPRTIIDQVAGLAMGLMDELPPESRVRLLDAGIAMPGRMAHVLASLGASEEVVALWADLSPAAELEHRLGLSVYAFKDGNAACWGELIALEPPRPASFIYLLVSTYVGAGIFGDGRLWEGVTDNSADLGSMLIRVDGGETQSAHDVASLSALEARLRQAGFSVDLDDGENWDLAAMETEIEAWMGDAARALAVVIFNTMRVIDAGLIVVDTILPALSDRLVARVAAELEKLPTANASPPKVQRGRLGRLSPAVGAAELPLYRRHFSRAQGLDPHR